MDFFLDGFVQVTEVDLTCSRLQDSGAVVQLKWCGKRAGAGEREGGGGGVSLPFFPPTPPFPDCARPIFAWLALFFSRPYCLKAWHRLILTKLWLAIFGCQWKPSTNSNLFCLPRRFYSPQGERVTKNSFTCSTLSHGRIWIIINTSHFTFSTFADPCFSLIIIM